MHIFNTTFFGGLSHMNMSLYDMGHIIYVTKETFNSKNCV